MTLSLDTAYRSFGGEVEASSTPTICRLPDSRRHQLWAIARIEEPWRTGYPACAGYDGLWAGAPSTSFASAPGNPAVFIVRPIQPSDPAHILLIIPHRGKQIQFR